MSDISDDDDASYNLPDDEVREIKRAMVCSINFSPSHFAKLTGCSLLWPLIESSKGKEAVPVYANEA